MPQVYLSSILKVAEESQPPQGHSLATIGKKICPQHKEQDCPSHPSPILKSHLRKRLEVHLQIIIANMLAKVGKPQQVYAKLYTRLTLQVDDGPMGSQTDHLVEVVRSHSYLILSNMESVGSVPPPLSQSLDQHIIG